MYDEHAGHLSIDFHSGISRIAYFKRQVNVIAFFSLLLIVFAFGAAYVRPIAEAFFLRMLNGDHVLLLSMMDIWDMFTYVCHFFLPLLVVLLSYRDPGFRPYIPFRPHLPAHSLSVIFASVGILFVFGILNSAFFSFVEKFGLVVPVISVEFPQTPLRLVLYFISAVILPPFVEELIYRGFVMHLLLPYGKTFAILGSAVLFGLMHLSLSTFLYATVAGVLLGYFVVKSGSVWIGIFIHLSNNLLSFLIQTAECLFSDPFSAILVSVIRCTTVFLGLIGCLILCLHSMKKEDRITFESGSHYNRVLDNRSVLRASMTLPMIVYLICGCYYMMINTFLI